MLAARAAWLTIVSFSCSVWLLGCEADLTDRHQHVAALSAALRPLPGIATEPPYFQAGDRIEQHDSRAGFFRVHYTRNGRHAVPPDDLDGDRTPDYVTRVADDFDRVLEFYKELGYREPVRDGSVPAEHGGDDRFDVYLLDFPNAGADGQFKRDTGCAAEPCGGYMLLENDFRGKGYTSLELAIRLVSSHELFHAVQLAYSTEITGWLSEGTAVWASEAFDPDAGDVERQAKPYFERPESSLAEDPTGIDPIIYAGGVFFQLLDEHAGRDVLRRMFEILSDTGDSWPSALDAALREHGSSIAEQFSTFAEWNLFTGDRADPERAYLRGEQLPMIKEREVEPGYKDDAVRVFPLAARYYTLRVDAADSVIARAELPDETSINDLQLMIALEHDGRISQVERALPGQRRELQVELEAGDTAHVVLYNTANKGASARPDLCITTGSTKNQCESDTEPATDNEAKAADADGGCAVFTAHAQKPPIWLVCAGAAFALALTRRRRFRSCAKPRV
jgi:hypothetical protein